MVLRFCLIRFDINRSTLYFRSVLGSVGWSASQVLEVVFLGRGMDQDIVHIDLGIG